MCNKCLSFLLFVVLLFFVIACTSTQDMSQTQPETEAKIDMQPKTENISNTENITDISLTKTKFKVDGSKPENEGVDEVKNEAPKYESVLIFVDDFTYKQLESELNTLANDIKNDISADVSIKHFNNFNPLEIRNIIKEYYQNKGLLGSILIGDIPTVMIENAGGGWTGNVAYPSDSYYQDLDDTLWTDFNKNGYFDARIGLQPPVAIKEVWSGRIKPTETGEKSIVQLQDYLNKNHAYRTSPPTLSKKLLFYQAVEEEVEKGNPNLENWLDDSMKNIARYTANDPYQPFLNYQDVDYVNFVNLPTPEEEKEDYFFKLGNTDYELVFTEIHGSPSSVYIGSANKGIDITSQEIRELKPRGLFYIMASCSIARFTEPQYYGGELIFNGNGLGVYGFTEPVGISGAEKLLGVDFLGSYSPLRLGIIWGDIIKHDTTPIAVFLGDPTLRLRPKFKKLESLKWEVAGPLFDEISLGEKATIFRIKNLGSEPLLLSAVSTPGNYIAINNYVLIEENKKSLYPDIAANPIYTTEEFLIGLILPSEKDIWSKGTITSGALSGFTLLENETLDFVVDLTIPKRNIDSELEEELVQFYHTNDASRPYIKLHAKVRIKPPLGPIQIQPKGTERG